MNIKEIDYENDGIVIPNDQKYLIEMTVSPLQIDEKKYPDIASHIAEFIYTNFPKWVAESIEYHCIEYKQSRDELEKITFILTGEPESPTH